MDLRQRVTSLRDSWLLAADIMETSGDSTPDMEKVAKMVRYYAAELTNILEMEESHAIGGQVHDA